MFVVFFLFIIDLNDVDYLMLYGVDELLVYIGVCFFVNFYIVYVRLFCIFI